MKTALLIILFTTICLLHAGAAISNIPVYPNLDAQKLAGRWYPIAAVHHKPEPMSTIRFDDVVEPSGKDLVLKIRYVHDGKCQVRKVDMVHTNQPGVFKIPASSAITYLLDIDYESYHILLREANDQCGLFLLSRTRKASDASITTFTRLAETLGFDVNKITYYTLAGKSEFGGMCEECATSIMSIMVLQMTLTANGYNF